MTGVERLVLGSVAEKVVREAQCTVEVARAKTYEYIALLDIVGAKEHRHYAPPHRYAYENRNITVRPLDWPLY